MHRSRLYLLTLAGLTLIVLVVSSLSVQYLIRISREEILHTQLEASQREAREVARVLAVQVANGTPAPAIIAGLQQSIENSSTETGFLCMYNTAGIELCHPDPRKVGMVIAQGNSQITNAGETPATDFRALLNRGQAAGGIRNFGHEDRTEVVYVYPVKNTDWMLAAHANISHQEERLTALQTTFILIHIIAAAAIIVLSFFTIRWLTHHYERSLEQTNNQLADDVRTLTRLNANLSDYKDRILVLEQKTEPATTPHTATTEKTKTRLLTYWRDELITLQVTDIACCYTRNDLTHIQCRDAKVHTTNASLDELYETFDNRLFFRANRQFIISIHAIDKIYRYGANQLKITLNPPAPEDIIISKNKASDFKDWLNS